MRVAHIIDSWLGLYGAEVMLLNLMEEQLKIGITPVLISLGGRHEGEKPIEKEARRRGIHSCELRLARGLSIRTASELLVALRTERIDLAHSHGYKGDILMGLLPKFWRRIPVISTIHGWIAVRRFTKIWLYMYLNKILLRRLDAVVKVNGVPWKGINALLFWGVKSFVVENGLGPLFDPSKEPMKREQEVEMFCKNGFIVGAIGRLSPEKGYCYLIDAFEILLKADSSYKLVVIGEGRLRPELEAMIYSKGLTKQILLAGYLGNASGYLNLFDVVVLPSLTEGLPMTLLEALQAEIPVVATRVGGMPEALGYGEYGTLVGAKDGNALAEAILDIKNNWKHAAARAEKARGMFKFRYSSRRMAEDYRKIYDFILKRPNFAGRSQLPGI